MCVCIYIYLGWGQGIGVRARILSLSLDGDLKKVFGLTPTPVKPGIHPIGSRPFRDPTLQVFLPTLVVGCIQNAFLGV